MRARGERGRSEGLPSLEGPGVGRQNTRQQITL